MQFGLDVLGGAKYGNLLNHEWPQGWILGIFAEAFGDAYPIVDSLFHTGRCPGARIQLVWDDRHNYGHQNIQKIVALAKRYNLLAKKYPDIKIELSPFCEHNIPNPDFFLEMVAQAAPNCGVVNTPWKGAISNIYKNEVHGGTKHPNGSYNFSFDGVNCVDSDVETLKKVHQNCDTFFFWHPRFNGKWSMNDNTPRVERHGWPDGKLLDSVIYLHRDKGDTKLPINWTLKSHSEKHNAEDSKGDHLMFISPQQSDVIQLKARNGQLIDTLKYWGTYIDGGFRYYSSKWGFEVAERARRIQGDSLCTVWQKGHIVGTVNPAFRENHYRI